MVLPMNEANFEPITARDGIALINCWAPWCPNCDGFGKAYAVASERHPGLRFASLDVQAEKRIRTTMNIQHVPTLMIFRDGLLVFKQPGNFDESALEDLIHQVENLDMDRVRAELEAEQDSSAA